MFAITHRQVVGILSGVAVAAIAGMRLVGAAEDKKDEPLSPEPTIVVDNRPESGVPPEALAQIYVKLSAAEKAANDALRAKGYPLRLGTLTAGTIKTVRIRYYNKETWAAEKQAREYVAGFLAHKSLDVYDFQIWSQGVGVPEIECIVEFTDEYSLVRMDKGLWQRFRELHFDREITDEEMSALDAKLRSYGIDPRESVDEDDD